MIRLFTNDTWVKPFFKQYKKTLALALGLGLLSFTFAAALMFTSGYLVSASAVAETIFMLHIPLILVRVFGVGKPVLQYLERLASHDWVLRMTSGLRVKLYTALERASIPGRSQRRLGDILGLLSQDIAHIQNLYLRTIFPLVIAYALYALFLVFLGVFSIYLALLMAVVLGVVVFVVPLLSVLWQGSYQQQIKQLRNNLYTELTDNVLGLGDWICAQRGRDYVTRHEKYQSELSDLKRRMRAIARRRNLLIEVIFCSIVLLMCLWAASTFALPGQTGESSHWIAAFLLVFFPLIEAFAPLSDSLVEASAHKDSIVRLNEIPTPPNEPGIADSASNVTRACSLSAASLDRTLEVENVAFSYEDHEPVIKNVSFEVEPQEKIALLGRSGVGKSTLLSLIRGDLAPQVGSVRLGGVKVTELGDQRPKLIGVIQQQTHIFASSLRENLLIGNPQATDKELVEVIEAVGLNEVMQRLPKGLDTFVEEDGGIFSGGERHRLALARILLSDVSLVLLDEPTVGLDPVTERALLETIFTLLRDKTVIMVTHHLSGIHYMDRVFFLDKGEISLEGKPEDLRKSSAKFQELLKFDYT